MFYFDKFDSILIFLVKNILLYKRIKRIIIRIFSYKLYLICLGDNLLISRDRCYAFLKLLDNQIH